jgi:hypothetical protein
MGHHQLGSFKVYTVLFPKILPKIKIFLEKEGASLTLFVCKLYTMLR